MKRIMALFIALLIITPSLGVARPTTIKVKNKIVKCSPISYHGPVMMGGCKVKNSIR